MSKSRSRHFTADKRNRLKQNEEEDSKEENKSVIEEEKKLCTDGNNFPVEIREYKPSHKDNSYFFSELEKDIDDDEPDDDEEDEYAEEEYWEDQDIQEQSNWFDRENEDDQDDFNQDMKVQPKTFPTVCYLGLSSASFKESEWK